MTKSISFDILKKIIVICSLLFTKLKVSDNYFKEIKLTAIKYQYRSQVDDKRDKLRFTVILTVLKLKLRG